MNIYLRTENVFIYTYIWSYIGVKKRSTGQNLRREKKLRETVQNLRVSLVFI